MKYFNFLLENEINFTRDENGYYVALVKVLNPQFYGDQPINEGKGAFIGDNSNRFGVGQQSIQGFKNNENEEAKPRSASQVSGSKNERMNASNKNNLRSKSPIGKNHFEKNENKKVKFF